MIKTSQLFKINTCLFIQTNSVIVYDHINIF